jgi:putative DNA primase/helicase
MLTFESGLIGIFKRHLPSSDTDPAMTAQSQIQDVSEEIIKRLAQLTPLQYEHKRIQAALKLKIRTTALDKLVETQRRKNSTNENLQGRRLEFPKIEPWPDPVNGAEVLLDVANAFSRYMSLPTGAADVLALWCAHAHAFEAFQCSPRLNITSPEKQCGKTTLRDLIALLVPRPMPTENLTVAVLFRAVQSSKPTVLADECDAWLGKNDEMRALLNAGHRLGGQVYRCEGDRNEVRGFEVFAPAVLCGIGALPGTLHDRSIKIRLRRAKRGEVQERFDSRRTQREVELCRKLGRFSADNLTLLKECDPVLPPNAFNRLADNWRPLFEIAEIAGGDWPTRASHAFTQLVMKEETDAHGEGTMLLVDIREILKETNSDRIFSRSLVEELFGLSHRPWPEANRGRAITENWLARRLALFGIKPKTMRIDDARAKGYEVADFTEAFDRYLTESDSSIRDTVTSAQRLDSEAFVQRDNDGGCHGSEAPQTRTNPTLSRCHGSEPSDQRCPFCKEIGLTLRSTGNNGNRITEKRCPHCRELVETYFPA